MAGSLISRLIAPLVHRQTQERISFVMEVPIFRGLSALQAGRLLTHCVERRYETGETIFEEGDMGKALFLVLSGRVNIVKDVKGDENDLILATLESGSYFGELALLDTLPRSAGARTLTQTDVLILYKSDFDALIERRADIGLPVMKTIAETLSGQLRRMNEQLAQSHEDTEE